MRWVTWVLAVVAVVAIAVAAASIWFTVKLVDYAGSGLPHDGFAPRVYWGGWERDQLYAEGWLVPDNFSPLDSVIGIVAMCTSNDRLCRVAELYGSHDGRLLMADHYVWHAAVWENDRIVAVNESECRRDFWTFVPETNAGSFESQEKDPRERGATCSSSGEPAVRRGHLGQSWEAIPATRKTGH